MKKRFLNGLKKVLFAAAVITTVVAVTPSSTEAATKIKLDKTKITCTAKERFTLKVKGSKKKATWTSSNKKIATVTKYGGNVVTKKAGTVTITAKVGKKTAKCKVTVKKAPSKPYLTVKSKTLHVGESFLLIQGQYLDYESTFSYNDTIATVDYTGKVTATGIGTTKILVNRGQDSQGRYRDYICTITVVPGNATPCKHQWMDAWAYDKNGKGKGTAFVLSKVRSESYYECTADGCHEKFLTTADFEDHVVENLSHDGSITAGGGTDYNSLKFCKFYCSKCGETKW